MKITRKQFVGSVAATVALGWRGASAAPGKWMPAVVPGTVLNTLVKNGVVPDPYYGLNNTSAISPRGKTSDKP